MLSGKLSLSTTPMSAFNSSRRLLVLLPFLLFLLHLLAWSADFHYPARLEGNFIFAYGKPKRTHVAIVSHSTHDSDSYMFLAAAHAFSQALNNHGDVTVFAPKSLLNGLEEIVDDIGLYGGRVHPPESFIHALSSTDFFPQHPEESFDLVIAGTCEEE